MNSPENNITKMPLKGHFFVVKTTFRQYLMYE
jgi:hypothetical protein